MNKTQAQDEILRVDGLSYQIDKVKLLSQIGFSVKKHEFVGLIGPNGCGKSTLLKNIYRHYQPSEGTVYLDEPTNHLDIGYQLLIMDTMKKQRETTIFTSVHDMNIAARYCDRILVMDKGHLIALGDPKEVLTPALIRKVFHVDAGIWKNPADGSLQVTYKNYVE